MCGVIGTIYVEALQWIITRELLQLSGILTPDKKPTPPSPYTGDIPKNAVALYLGNSVFYTDKFPHTVIEVGKEQAIVINKKEDKITISAKLFSRDGKIVAELRENKFYINPNNYFRIERPNEHTLIVYDQESNQILNVEYLNPYVIKFLGRLYFPNHMPIIITEDCVYIGTNKLQSICVINCGVDIHIE